MSPDQRSDSLTELTGRLLRETESEPDAYRIFVSYRRDDAAHAAGRLYDALEKRFPANQIFMDVDNVEPGVDFVHVLNDAVGACDVLLAVIGKRWLTQRRGGLRRLDDPNDWVRIELEAALTRGIRLIPVLTDGAVMPKAEALPEPLRPLIRRQAVDLPHEHFRVNAAKLADVLEGLAHAKAKEGERVAREQREKEAAEQAEQKRQRQASAAERAKQQAAERERLARERAEREALARAAAEAAEREQAALEKADRKRIAERLAEVEGVQWKDLSDANKARYLDLIGMVRDDGLSAEALAEQEGRAWILLDADERWTYRMFVNEALKPRSLD